MVVDREQIKAYVKILQTVAEGAEAENLSIRYRQISNNNPTPLAVGCESGSDGTIVAHQAYAPPLAVRFTAESVGPIENRSGGGAVSASDWTAPLAKPADSAEAEAFAEWFVSAIDPFIRGHHGPDHQPEAEAEFNRFYRLTDAGGRINYNSADGWWSVHFEGKNPTPFETLKQLAEGDW